MEKIVPSRFKSRTSRLAQMDAESATLQQAIERLGAGIEAGTAELTALDEENTAGTQRRDAHDDDHGADREPDAALADEVATQLTAHDALGAHARDELGMSAITQARPACNAAKMPSPVAVRGSGTSESIARLT